MIDLADEHLAAVKEILAERMPEVEVRVFGSRIAGTAERFSDLDLVLVGDGRLDADGTEDLKDAFAESDLPFRVDVLDWHLLSENFRRLIDRRFEVIQRRCPAEELDAGG